MNKLLIYSTTWMNLKYIGLHETCQFQKPTYYMIALMWHSGKGKTIRTENRSMVTKGWEGMNGWLPTGNFDDNATVLYCPQVVGIWFYAFVKPPTLYITKSELYANLKKLTRMLGVPGREWGWWQMALTVLQSYDITSWKSGGWRGAAVLSYCGKWWD